MLRLHRDSSRFISGETCPTRGRTVRQPPFMATCRVIRQESAAAIVDVRKQARRKWRKAGKDLPRRRAKHEEGKNNHELS